ncbi:hypothetical protein MXB_5067, partial [Myxobolus squamalis]
LNTTHKKYFIACAVHLNQTGVWLIGKHTCRKPIADIGEFSSAKTYTVERLGFYFAAFTIPTKQQVANKVQLRSENLERKPSNFAMAGWQYIKNNLCLIDVTRRIALHLFYQALVIITFDRAKYRKGQRLYLRLFHKIIATLDWVWEPEAVVCDFEHRLSKDI